MTHSQLSDAALLHGLRLCGPCSTCAQLRPVQGVAYPHCIELSRVIEKPAEFGCWKHEPSKPCT